MDQHKRKSLLGVLERLEGVTSTLRAILQDSQPTPIHTPTPTPPASPKVSGRGPKLGPTPPIDDPDWPQAVQPNLIVSNRGEPEKQFRALQVAGIINDIIGTTPRASRILDCGCGEGHIAKELAGCYESVVGYDIKEDDNWQDKPDNLIFTTNKEQVATLGLYDLIVLYDVLDHVTGESPPTFMQWISSLLTNHGKVFVRTHPWTSRHGGHLYESVNKAYLHLALTPDELIQAGIQPKFIVQVTRPLATYQEWFKSAGLNIKSRRIQAEPPEDYFKGPILKRIINTTWKGNIDAESARKIMTNQFIDFLLVNV